MGNKATYLGIGVGEAGDPDFEGILSVPTTTKIELTNLEFHTGE